MSKNKKLIKKMLKNKRIRLFILLTLLLGIIASAYLVRNITLYQPKADAVSIYFEPTTGSLPPDSSFRIMVDSGAQQGIGFVRVDFSFDPSLVNLSDEIQITGPLTTVIQQTSSANANGSGLATVVLGLPPEQRGNPPTGIFEIASVPFQAVTVEPLNTDVSFIQANIQIVRMDQAELPANTSDLILALNGGTPPSDAIITSNITLQGITSQGVDRTLDMTFEQGGQVIHSFDDLTVSSEANGVLVIYLENLTPGYHDVFIKPTPYLRRRFDNILLDSGTNNTFDWTSSSFIAADFNDDNILNIMDIASILSQYTALNVPVDAGNQVYDLDANNTINIVDIALVLSNYTALEVNGD